MRPFPTFRLRIWLLIYRSAWWLLLPFGLLYLRRRARKDPLYGQHLSERFGRYPSMPGAIWIHAVSLGELRSAVPLIRAFLSKGERVVTTHFTPAGRREAETVFASEIASGQLRPVWVPFEFGWCFRRFFNAFRPKLGLVMEIEIWPVMIMASRRVGVPLFMCNAQYPSKSYKRDTTRTKARADLFRGFAGALVKSELQRDRFASVGVENIWVTGETRFEQPIPPELVAAGTRARTWLAPDRPVITFSSVVEGEDERFIEVMKAYPEPLYVYVPRKPERFGDVRKLLEAAGLKVLTRTSALDAKLAPKRLSPKVDVLLGDSLGEMYFYLSLADRVVVGGGFTLAGSHNIIEPLSLRKPTIIGPEIWTIEYPAIEAIAAGVCLQVKTKGDLTAALSSPFLPNPALIDTFLDAHGGAKDKTLAALREALPSLDLD